MLLSIISIECERSSLLFLSLMKQPLKTDSYFLNNSAILCLFSAFDLLQLCTAIKSNLRQS